MSIVIIKPHWMEVANMSLTWQRSKFFFYSIPQLGSCSLGGIHLHTVLHSSQNFPLKHSSSSLSPATRTEVNNRELALLGNGAALHLHSWYCISEGTDITQVTCLLACRFDICLSIQSSGNLIDFYNSAFTSNYQRYCLCFF